MYFSQVILNDLNQLYKQTIMIKTVENGGDGSAGKHNKKSVSSGIQGGRILPQICTASA